MGRKAAEIGLRRIMGDRFEPKRHYRRYGLTKLPEPLATWGIGHNGGPELEDEPPGYLWRRHCWNKAHREVWKNPGMSLMKFRVARAEAAGVSYREYMLHLLDTGRYLQKEDVDAKKKDPEPGSK
jgi:hypothetical protein